MHTHTQRHTWTHTHTHTCTHIRTRTHTHTHTHARTHAHCCWPRTPYRYFWYWENAKKVLRQTPPSCSNLPTKSFPFSEKVSMPTFTQWKVQRMDVLSLPVLWDYTKWNLISWAPLAPTPGKTRLRLGHLRGVTLTRISTQHISVHT